MNPYTCRIVLRPRGTFEVFDLAGRLLATDAGPVARLALVVCLPAWAAALVLGYVVGDPWVALLALVLFLPVLQLPFTLLLARRLFDPRAGVAAALRASLRRPGALLAAHGAWWIVLLGGLISAGLFWLPLHASVRFLPETALLEDKSMVAAVRRAGGLAADQLGSAVVGALAAATAAAWLVVAAEATGQLVVGWLLQLGTPFGAAHQGTPTPFVLLGVAVAQPVLACFRLLHYVDVRTVHEGWDLQVALRAAAEEA